jgi:hypothetical protein
MPWQDRAVSRKTASIRCMLWLMALSASSGGAADHVGNKPTTPAAQLKSWPCPALCATDQLTPDRDRTRYSKNARRGRDKYGLPPSGFCSSPSISASEKRSAAQAEYDRSAAQA